MVINLKTIENWKTLAMKEIVKKLGEYPDEVSSWEIKIENDITYGSYEQDCFVEEKYYICVSYQFDDRELCHSMLVHTE
ncbi:MAG: hypothetical protein EHM12_10200 [Dehalococcoidia bacterium]|nr:MAG: hypothetical protein EHM12_10200 [Dehalococcoidia bacterium]